MFNSLLFAVSNNNLSPQSASNGRKFCSDRLLLISMVTNIQIEAGPRTHCGQSNAGLQTIVTNDVLYYSL